MHAPSDVGPGGPSFLFVMGRATGRHAVPAVVDGRGSCHDAYSLFESRPTRPDVPGWPLYDVGGAKRRNAYHFSPLAV
jgi:hypothetical protein